MNHESHKLDYFIKAIIIKKKSHKQQCFISYQYIAAAEAVLNVATAVLYS